jgi:hypothetical protein
MRTGGGIGAVQNMSMPKADRQYLVHFGMVLIEDSWKNIAGRSSGSLVLVEEAQTLRTQPQAGDMNMAHLDGQNV